MPKFNIIANTNPTIANDWTAPKGARYASFKGGGEMTTYLVKVPQTSFGAVWE